MWQEQFQHLIGMPSGLVDDMTPAQKKRIGALKQLQRKHLELEFEFHNEVAELERKYLELYRPLYEKVRA